MKTITYGIFAEDEAIKIFVENAVPQMVKHCGFSERVEFHHSDDFSTYVVAKSKHYVREKFLDAAGVGIKRFDMELCFVGLDADTDDDQHAGLYEAMRQEAAEKSMDNTVIILIPVQAIEYWLWYLKMKKDNSGLPKTIRIESIKTRSELKVEVYKYSSRTASTKKSNPIVKDLTKSIDFPWLIDHSASFRHFYDTFHTYLKTQFTEQ